MADAILHTLRLATLAALFATPPAVRAEGPANTFSAATRAYEAGRFEEAARLFQKDGPSTLNGFYNLGNALARSGQPGLAALAYQRTLLLAPRHFEACANLRHLTGNADPADLRDRLHPDLGPWIASAGLWALVFALLCLRLPGLRASTPVTRRLLSSVALVGLLALLAGSALWRMVGRGGLDPRAAVAVSAEPAPARFAPARNSPEVARVRPGQRLLVLGESAGWVYCQLSPKARGWIESACVSRIRPFRT